MNFTFNAIDNLGFFPSAKLIFSINEFLNIIDVIYIFFVFFEHHFMSDPPFHHSTARTTQLKYSLKYLNPTILLWLSVSRICASEVIASIASDLAVFIMIWILLTFALPLKQYQFQEFCHALQWQSQNRQLPTPVWIRKVG